MNSRKWQVGVKRCLVISSLPESYNELQEQRLSARTWLAQFQAVQQETQWENMLKNLSGQLCFSGLAGTLLKLSIVSSMYHTRHSSAHCLDCF